MPIRDLIDRVHQQTGEKKTDLEPFHRKDKQSIEAYKLQNNGQLPINVSKDNNAQRITDDFMNKHQERKSQARKIRENNENHQITKYRPDDSSGSTEYHMESKARHFTRNRENESSTTNITHNDNLKNHDEDLTNSLTEDEIWSLQKLISIDMKIYKQAKRAYDVSKNNYNHNADIMTTYRNRSDNLEDIIEYNNWREDRKATLSKEKALTLAYTAITSWQRLKIGAESPITAHDREQLHKFIKYDHHKQLENHDKDLENSLTSANDIQAFQELTSADIEYSKQIKTAYDTIKNNSSIHDNIRLIYTNRSNNLKNITNYNQ